jgi:hypothetical protein
VNKRRVLDRLNVLNGYSSNTTIRKYSKDLGVDTEAAYKYLLEMYNQEIDIIREEKKVELKRNKLTLNLLSHFPASEPTQRSRDERVQARLHNELLEGLPRNTRQTNANEFTTQELRALGVFTEITIDNVNNENIYEAIHNTILNVFLTKPSNRNMGVNIIAEYFMQSSQ